MNPNRNKSSNRTETKRTNPFITTNSLAIAVFWLVTIASLLLFADLVRADELPFKGRIDGNFIASPTSNLPIFVSEAHAVGNATHTGAFTKVTSDVVNIVTGEVEGSFTMTTANGDLLTGVYSGFTVPAPDGSFSWVLNATFTGGTGRFVHATGEFVFIAEGEYVVVDGSIYGTYTETFDGTINY
jgi:hypothetical protein